MEENWEIEEIHYECKSTFEYKVGYKDGFEEAMKKFKDITKEILYAQYNPTVALELCVVLGRIDEELKKNDVD